MKVNKHKGLIKNSNIISIDAFLLKQDGRYGEANNVSTTPVRRSSRIRNRAVTSPWTMMVGLLNWAQLTKQHCISTPKCWGIWAVSASACVDFQLDLIMLELIWLESIDFNLYLTPNWSIKSFVFFFLCLKGFSFSIIYVLNPFHLI